MSKALATMSRDASLFNGISEHAAAVGKKRGQCNMCRQKPNTQATQRTCIDKLILGHLANTLKGTGGNIRSKQNFMVSGWTPKGTTSCLLSPNFPNHLRNQRTQTQMARTRKSEICLQRWRPHCLAELCATPPLDIRSWDCNWKGDSANACQYLKTTAPTPANRNAFLFTPVMKVSCETATTNFPENV